MAHYKFLEYRSQKIEIPDNTFNDYISVITLPKIRSLVFLLHSILDSDEYNLVKSGIMNLVFRSCILTELRGVTLSNISPPDIFHDLFGMLNSIPSKEIWAFNGMLEITSSENENFFCQVFQVN